MSMPMDSEILEMEKVLAKVKAKEGKSTNLESFRKEILERFANIGWLANVDVWSTDTGAFAFDVNLIDRISPSPHGTDYERMKWEIVNDIAEIEPDKKGKTFEFSENGMHNSDLAD